MLILNPREAPVIQVDSHLPAPASDRLTGQALRQRVAHPPVWTPEFEGDGGRDAARPQSAAAVLIPLVRHPHGITVLLTQRTDHLRAHAGQVSFPGGRCEPADPDATATALRETQEEIGLHAGHVEVIGLMPKYRTVTNFVITPVIALVEPGFTLAPDAFEVAQVFETPLAFLMDPANHRRHRYEREGVVRHFYSMPWTDPAARPGEGEHFIWGATAAMLRNLYRLLSA